MQGNIGALKFDTWYLKFLLIKKILVFHDGGSRARITIFRNCERACCNFAW